MRILLSDFTKCSPCKDQTLAYPIRSEISKTREAVLVAAVYTANLPIAADSLQRRRIQFIPHLVERLGKRLDGLRSRKRILLTQHVSWHSRHPEGACLVNISL